MIRLYLKRNIHYRNYYGIGSVNLNIIYKKYSINSNEQANNILSKQHKDILLKVTNDIIQTNGYNNETKEYLDEWLMSRHSIPSHLYNDGIKKWKSKIKRIKYGNRLFGSNWEDVRDSLMHFSWNNGDNIGDNVSYLLPSNIDSFSYDDIIDQCEQNKLITRLDDSDNKYRDEVFYSMVSHTLSNFIYDELQSDIDFYKNIVETTDLSSPHLWYPKTRIMKRKIIFHGGPTNSGKTHHALNRLREADPEKGGGLYLSPLRLLALEIYHKLNQEGYYSSLLTGQEKYLLPGCTHVSATIEMLSSDFSSNISNMNEKLGTPKREKPKRPSWKVFGHHYDEILNDKKLGTSNYNNNNNNNNNNKNKTRELYQFNNFSHNNADLEHDVFDIAVIDEIQMIGNEERGQYWTNALLSLKAREIHLCGGTEALSIVKNLLKNTNDELIIKNYERLSPLKIEDESLNMDYSNVQAGDCIVAFNKNDIFAIKKEIEEKTNHKCCIVYGQLPPETRAHQARLFNKSVSNLFTIKESFIDNNENKVNSNIDNDENENYDILVASDAVGMGLNLNIRRIIFHTVFKGAPVEKIGVELVGDIGMRQIGGRAGRGKRTGLVTCYRKSDMPYLRYILDQPPHDIVNAGLFPSFEPLKRFSELYIENELQKNKNKNKNTIDESINSNIDNVNLEEMIKRFIELSQLSGNYFLCTGKTIMKIANKLQEVTNLSLNDRFIYCLAPINIRNEYLSQKLLEWATKHSNGEPVSLYVDLLKYPRRATDFVNLCWKFSTLELYLWLNQRFPAFYFQRELALEQKNRSLELIKKGLKRKMEVPWRHRNNSSEIRNFFFNKIFSDNISKEFEDIFLTNVDRELYNEIEDWAKSNNEGSNDNKEEEEVELDLNIYQERLSNERNIDNQIQLSVLREMKDLWLLEDEAWISNNKNNSNNGNNNYNNRRNKNRNNGRKNQGYKGKYKNKRKNYNKKKNDDDLVGWLKQQEKQLYKTKTQKRKGRTKRLS